MSNFGRIIQSMLRLLFLGCITCCLFGGLYMAGSFDRDEPYSETVLSEDEKIDNQLELENQSALLKKVPYPRQHVRSVRSAA